MPEQNNTRIKRQRSAKHRTNRKDDILRVAAKLFANKGYHSVSMNNIARNVGLSKTSLYHYFDRKEEILGSIVVATVQKLSEHVEQAIRAHQSPDAQLVAFMEAHADFFEKHQSAFQVLLTRTANLRDPSMRDVPVEWRANYQNTIRNIIRDGVNQGLFRAENPDAVVRAVISSVYWLARWYHPFGKQTPTEIAREYAEIYLHGIMLPNTSY